MSHGPIRPDAVETFPDRWPAELHALAGPLALRPLSQDATLCLIAQEPATRSALGLASRPAMPEELRRTADALFEAVGSPAFARISPCSFKDGMMGTAPLSSPDALIRRLQHPGLRAASLALRSHWGGVRISLILRPWLRMRPWEEFRLFIRAGMLSGVSQLHRGAMVPSFSNGRDEPLVTTLGRFGDRVAEVAHLENFVADVFLPADGGSAVLIEINPWGYWTDPCLYDWRHDPPVDRALRLRRSGGLCSIALPV